MPANFDEEGDWDYLKQFVEAHVVSRAFTTEKVF